MKGTPVKYWEGRTPPPEYYAKKAQIDESLIIFF